MSTLTVQVLCEGERVPLLLDSSGIPLFYPTLYVTSQLRNAGLAVNTIRNKLADIVVLFRWEAAHERDLLSEFRQGQFLTVADIVSLRDFAQLDMREVDELAKSSGSRSNSSKGQFLEAYVASSSPLATVRGQQHYNRLSTQADYLEFVATVVTQHKGSSQDAASIAAMARTIRKHRPRGLADRWSDDLQERSPPSELIERFMAMTAVDHPRNPFRNESIRERNAILFGLLRYTGMRRGELLSLRIDQFDLGNEPLVWVRRNQDDRHDSRRYQPVAKTKERPMPLPRELADQIQNYILKVRAKIPPARKHPYLLVTHRKGKAYGQPLSVSALGSQIMSRMREVDPDFSVIHAHAFRHHLNYELSVLVDAHNKQASHDQRGDTIRPISEAQEQDVRAFVNGHRDKASGATYNRRHVRELADQAVRQVQEGMCVRTPGSDDDSNQ